MNKESIEVLQSKYKLTEEEYDEYIKTVLLYFTTGKKKVDKPSLLFVAGQAGAGKSKLIPIANKELDYNVVISDYDIVRSMHPKFNIASQEVRENVHFALLPDADRANKELRNYTREHGLNLIYEGTMRGTQVFLDISKEFKDSGYNIGLRLMSVPKLESYGSTLLRYATDLMNNNEPRWVPKEIHDESYNKFIITLQKLEEQKLFDCAKVYRRGNKEENGVPVQIYSSETNEFHNPIEAVNYGREHYRKDAIINYNMMHGLVCDIFSEKSPDLLLKLKDWEDFYELECLALNNIENTKQEE